MFCFEASRRGPSGGGEVSTKRVSRLASFRGGAENDEVRSFTAGLYHVTVTWSGWIVPRVLTARWIHQALFKMWLFDVWVTVSESLETLCAEEENGKRFFLYKKAIMCTLNNHWTETQCQLSTKTQILGLCFGHVNHLFSILCNSSQSLSLSSNCGRAHIRMRVHRASVEMQKLKRIWSSSKKSAI